MKEKGTRVDCATSPPSDMICGESCEEVFPSHIRVLPTESQQMGLHLVARSRVLPHMMAMRLR